MIKKFNIFEGVLNTDYLIGLPSGQIIDIDYKMINNLKQDGILKYNRSLNSYVFSDDNYELILQKLGKIKTPIRPSRSELDENYIYDFFDQQKTVRGFKILSDGVEVDGSIYIICRHVGFKKIPFKFKSVTGDFVWRDCRLDSLKNSPEKVGKSFIVDTNNLFDLKEGPKYVGENYDCSICLINSLEGAPEKIYGNFNCSDNFLKDLKGSPKIVKGKFDFSDNYITSMEFLPRCPNIIGGKFRKK